MNTTNKVLALFLVGALLVSITGTMIALNRVQEMSITGLAGSDTGNVTLTVNSTGSLTFVNRTINFGTGTVNISGGYLNCSMNSMGMIAMSNCVGWTNVTQALVLMNDGNKDLSVTIISSQSNVTLIGGTQGGGPRLEWNITNNESGACTFDTNFVATYQGLFTPVNTTTQNLCSNLSWLDTKDSMSIHVFVNIPGDSLTGQRNNTFTLTGTGLW